MPRMEKEKQALLTIGANIRASRKAKGWVLADLSEATGEPVNSLSRYERGENEPGAIALLRIARALGVSADSLDATPKKSRQLASA